ASREGDVSTLQVRDDGPGVPGQLRERVFEALFTTRAKGSGLGLALCRRIAEAHGGTVTLEPSERGALFKIWIPDADASPPQRGRQVGGTARGGGIATMPSPRMGDRCLQVEAPWSRAPEEVAVQLGSGLTGLPVEEAARRLATYGPNALAPEKTLSSLRLLFR